MTDLSSANIASVNLSLTTNTLSVNPSSTNTASTYQQSDVNEKKISAGFFYIISTADVPPGVYKIGKTIQTDPNKRLCRYPAYSSVKYTIAVENADLFEDIVMRKFKSTFKRRMELGIEYYEGDLINMVCQVHDLWVKYGQVKFATLLSSEKIKPNGWQYFVNEWLINHLNATDDEMYEGYVNTIINNFGSHEYAEKVYFLTYLKSTFM